MINKKTTMLMILDFIEDQWDEFMYLAKQHLPDIEKDVIESELEKNIKDLKNEI